MSRAVYDTRFFLEYFYSGNSHTLNRAKDDIQKTRERLVSTITIHELFKLILEKEGRAVAKVRTKTVHDYFKVVAVNSEIASEGAELRHRYGIPMGDSLIAATAKMARTNCVTDDPHFKKIKEIRTRWF